MNISKKQIEDALSEVKVPDGDKSIWEIGIVKKLVFPFKMNTLNTFVSRGGVPNYQNKIVFELVEFEITLLMSKIK